MRFFGGSTEELRPLRPLERTAETRRARLLHAMSEVNGPAAQPLLTQAALHKKDVGYCSRRRSRNDDIAHPIVERSAAAVEAKPSERRATLNRQKLGYLSDSRRI